MGHEKTKTKITLSQIAIFGFQALFKNSYNWFDLTWLFVDQDQCLYSLQSGLHKLLTVCHISQKICLFLYAHG